MEKERFSKMNLKSLPEPGSKFKLGLKIGGGVGGEVYEAVECQTGKKVAIKVLELTKETEDEIRQEQSILSELSSHENFPEFYGIYLKKETENSFKIWLVIELCEGGTATDITKKLIQENKKMSELFIAYILRETIKAVIHLHEKDICHRDIRGNNILLTTDGRVKLIDFGISRRLNKSKKMKTCIGSPSWMAPEVIAGQDEGGVDGYNKKADVWSIGITAIELGDGQAPLEDMHPGRVIFQIIQNPPPTLRKPSEWSQLYNDFISECLIKNPDNRPFIQELLVHTFFESIDKNENLKSELEALLESQKTVTLFKTPDVQVRKGFVKIEQQSKLEKILQEDLAALKDVSEDSVLMELHERFKRNEFYTYIGDVLLILNPNKNLELYGNKYHKKYKFKAKSQNAPHIYSVADSAYRDVFHHEKPQHILFAGETGAGKTYNMMHAVDHLLFLGEGLNCSKKVSKAIQIIHALGNAATPHNSDSTRHILQMQLTFTDTGKVSGAIFQIYQLEKGRVTSESKKQFNFHIFYYFYDAIKSQENLGQYHINSNTHYKFLYNGVESESSVNKNTKENIEKFKDFENNLKSLEFGEEHIQCIKNILAAIILIGEIEFEDKEEDVGVITTPEIVSNVADLLGVDKKKFSWALLNYCVIMKGEIIKRRNSKEEAYEAKNVLARGIHSRLMDWIVNMINEKLSIHRVIYGGRHIVSLLDIFGFECYKKNSLDQLFVNLTNEQLQFHYNQKIFYWDRKTEEEEGVTVPELSFNDNKLVIDQILPKPNGLLYKIDEATKNENPLHLMEYLKESKTSTMFAENSREFSINHYTGKLTYDSSKIMEKNKDFLPPELIEIMRLSSQTVTNQLFSPPLTKSGNLSTQANISSARSEGWDEGPLQKKKTQEIGLCPNQQGQYSQSRQMRTLTTIFRCTCLDVLKNLATSESGFHFVRCIRTNLSNKPQGFDPEVVRQQLRAIPAVNTILAMQQGYSYSVPHNEFIRRYKFLAFDFDENVEETKENCRLLLLRLKLEGWEMGKTKVFLKYYNQEYLSRLYETQIKKIVKVQSMMRSFMTRRKLYAKIKKYQADDGNSLRNRSEPANIEHMNMNHSSTKSEEYSESEQIKSLQKNIFNFLAKPGKNKNNSILEEENDNSELIEAALVIQKKYKEYASKKKIMSSSHVFTDLSETQKEFIKTWFKRWKTKSIFQVLLHYRAATLKTLVNFCLQIHLFSANTLNLVQNSNHEVNLEEVDLEANASTYLPPLKVPVRKVLFTWENLTSFGQVNNCEPLPDSDLDLIKYEIAQKILSKKETEENENNSYEAKPIITQKSFEDKEIQTITTEEPIMAKQDQTIVVLQDQNIAVEHYQRNVSMEDQKNDSEEDQNIINKQDQSTTTEQDQATVDTKDQSTSTEENQTNVNINNQKNGAEEFQTTTTAVAVPPQDKSTTKNPDERIAAEQDLSITITAAVATAAAFLAQDQPTTKNPDERIAAEHDQTIKTATPPFQEKPTAENQDQTAASVKDQTIVTDYEETSTNFQNEIITISQNKSQSYKVTCNAEILSEMESKYPKSSQNFNENSLENAFKHDNNIISKPKSITDTETKNTKRHSTYKIQKKLNEEKDTKRCKTPPDHQTSSNNCKTFKTPFEEIEEKFSQANINSDDDNPPFNFKAMLRKTNYPLNSSRNTNESLVYQVNNQNHVFGQKLKKTRSEPEIISTELVPGILIQGKITDL